MELEAKKISVTDVDGDIEVRNSDFKSITITAVQADLVCDMIQKVKIEIESNTMKERFDKATAKMVEDGLVESADETARCDAESISTAEGLRACRDAIERGSAGFALDPIVAVDGVTSSEDPATINKRIKPMVECEDDLPPC